MADFARWATAAECAFGVVRGGFMAAYDLNRREVSAQVLEGSFLAGALVDLVEKQGEEGWNGTVGKLYAELCERAAACGVRTIDMPKNARGLGTALKRLAPNLRATRGLVIEKLQRRREGQLIRLYLLPKALAA
jgi:hypothetical protein